jgi:hypothetical protein
MPGTDSPAGGRWDTPGTGADWRKTGASRLAYSRSPAASTTAASSLSDRADYLALLRQRLSFQYTHKPPTTKSAIAPRATPAQSRSNTIKLIVVRTTKVTTSQTMSFRVGHGLTNQSQNLRRVPVRFSCDIAYAVSREGEGRDLQEPARKTAGWLRLKKIVFYGVQNRPKGPPRRRHRPSAPNAGDIAVLDPGDRMAAGPAPRMVDRGHGGCLTEKR